MLYIPLKPIFTHTSEVSLSVFLIQIPHVPGIEFFGQVFVWIF